MSEKVLNTDSDGDCPYKDLHIYYIEGCLMPGSDDRFGDSYLGDWEEEGTSFLFFSRPEDDIISRLLSDQPGLVLHDSYQMAWKDWQARFPDMVEIGGFAFAAPWFGGETPLGKIRLTLDPGVVFGTGTHPTTAHCIEALEEVFAGDPPEKVLDLGCGTGILALAAKSLGAKTVTAVDLNPLAARTTKANVALNGMEESVAVVHGRAENWVDRPADLLMANIHAAVLKELVSHPGFARKKTVILSGLLRSQVGEIRDAVKSLPFKIKREWSCDGTWFTLLCQKT